MNYTLEVMYQYIIISDHQQKYIYIFTFLHTVISMFSFLTLQLDLQQYLTTSAIVWTGQEH